MKNYGIDLAEGAEIVNISVPTGTDFPGSPNNGELFYKTSDNVFYGYSNGSWVAISPPGGGGFLALTGGTLTGDLRVNSDIGINRDARTSLDVGGDVLVQPTTAADAYIRLRHGSSSVNSGLKSDSSGTLTAFTNDNVNAFSINTTGVVTFVNDPYVGANKIWHQGNDGAASGLDADLLDGQSGAYYLDWTNTTNKPDPVITLNGDVTGSGTMTDLGNVTITTSLAPTTSNKIFYGNTKVEIPSSNGPVVTTTSNIERMRVSESGDVGIGTSSPSTKLDISSTLTGTVVNTNTIMRMRSQAVGRDAHIRLGDTVNPDAMFGYLAGGLYLSTNDFERINVDEDGNVTVLGQSATPDGTTWVTRTAPSQAWHGVTYGAGLFVAVGGSGTNNRVMTSPDGITWTSRTSAADYNWRSVTYGNGLFVAVSNFAGGSTSSVMTSPDGITWTLRTPSSEYHWTSVTYGNGLFVAVSEQGSPSIGSVMTSPDGITWTDRTPSATNVSWSDVCFANGLFVAVADSGSISTDRVMTSPDGITWTGRSASEEKPWSSVTYGNGLYVAVAYTGTSGTAVMTSPDGITWTSRSTPDENFWVSIVYGDGIFVAVSAADAGDPPYAMTSLDGINWTSYTASASNWRSITYTNGIFVVVGDTGSSRVMTSGTFTALTERLSVRTTGNVLIALDVDDNLNKLQVGGDVYFDGDLDVTGTITGGNIAANTLVTTRSISITGDATWSVNFNGSANVTNPLTLAASGVSAGTYNNSATQVTPFTVDSKGRITSTSANVTITPHWNSITNTPTTLSGYGITDAASSAGTTYVGTTEIGLNRASANQALTGILSVAMPGSTSGTITIIPTAVAGSNTITFPAVTGNVVTTGDTATVTNTMLAGSIANAKLVNSSVTVGSTNIALGATSTTLAGLTSVNGLVLTANATGFSIAGGTTSKTLTMSNTLTFSGTDSSSVNFGAGGTVAYTGGTLAQFAATTSAQLAGVISDETGSGVLVFGTSPAITTSITTPSTTFSLLNTTATTVNFAGEATTINIGGGSGTTLIGHNLSVVGNLTVNGTTTTVNSTVVSLDDPILTLGGDTAPVSDDNKDRGIEFRWHNGTSAKVGFFGFDDSTGKFTFIPDATNTSEVFSGTKGTLDAYLDWANLTNIPSPTITLDGAVSGTGTLSASGGITITTTGGSLSGSKIYNGTSEVDIPSSNGHIEFLTDGSERMRIAANGHVLVNTTTDLGGNYLFQVSGDGRIANTLDVIDQIRTGNINPSGTTGVLRLISDSAGQYIQSGQNTTVGSSAPIIFSNYAATSEWMRIDATGDVGIGTNNPLYKLHVYGGAEQTIVSESSTTSGGNYQAKSTSGHYAFGMHGNGGGSWYIHDVTNDDLIHEYYASEGHKFYTSTTERIRILPSGFVGINESSPSRHLHVNSGASGTSARFTGVSAQSLYVYHDASISGIFDQSAAGGEGIYFNPSTSEVVVTTNPSSGARVAVGGTYIRPAVNDTYLLGTYSYRWAGAYIGKTFITTASYTSSTTTADQVITSFAVAGFRSAKFLIQVTSGSSYHVTELVVLHDGTTTYNNEYGTMFTGVSLATFNTDIDTGLVRLLTTPTNAVTTYKVQMTLIDV